MKDINILIADDNNYDLDSVKNHLTDMANQFQDQIQISLASSATEVFATLYTNKDKVDVLFLDYYFVGGMSGDEIIDKISDPSEEKIIILMSNRGKDELENVITKRYKTLGMRFKFLRKPFDSLEIQSLYLEIRNLLNQPKPDKINNANRITHQQKRSLAHSSHLESFGDKERKILQLLDKGKTDKEIAQELGLSFHTVRHYVREIISKLGVGNRREAAFKARDQGLI